MKEAKYNIYVQIPGKTGIVKINYDPVEDTYYTFNPTVSQLDLKFYVTLVYKNKESRLSEPLKFKFNYSKSNRLIFINKIICWILAKYESFGIIIAYKYVQQINHFSN